MKVIQLVSNRIWGGGERYALDLSAALRAEGIETVALTRGSEIVDSRFIAAGIPVDKAPFFGVLDLSTPKAICRIARQWADEDRIVIHAHNFRDGLAAVRAAGRLRKKGINAKVVITRHLVKPASTDHFNSLVYRRLDALVMVSDLVKERFMESDPAIDPDKINMIHNSIAVSAADRDSQDSETKRTPQILFVGRLVPEKGVSLLLEALVPVKDLLWKMVIAGSGTPEYEAELRSTARRLGIDGRIRWAGHVENIWPLMHSSDIGVVPSTWEEPFGLVLLEFMSAGVPVVTTDRGAQREIITDGHDGILTKADPASFSRGLRQLLESPDLRKKMGEAAKSSFKNHDYPTFLSNILNLYRSC